VFNDSAEESIFNEIFALTREYCDNRCLPRDIQKKVAVLARELPLRKKALKDFRNETAGLEVLL
jgi:hypothetical protein